MKQGEFEKNIGPSAPASPVATTFIPFVGEIGGKPVLVWGITSSGLARLKNTDFTHNSSAVPVSRIPAIRHLEVVEGKKSRYAVLKVGYMDLTTGNLVNDEVRAAIDKARAPAPVSVVAPVPAPTPAPVAAPAPTPVVTEAKAPATSKAPAFSWKDWWKLKGYRCWAHAYYGTDAGDGLHDEALDVFTALGGDCLKELSENVSNLTLDCDNEVDDVAAALAKYTTFTQNFKSDLDLLRSGPSCFDGDIDGIKWRPLTVSFPLTWEVREGDAELTSTRHGINLDPDDGYLIGISAEGWILFAKEEFIAAIEESGLVVVAKTHIQRMVLDRYNEGYIQAAQEVVESLAQEVYGYHPDQLTLF